MNDTTPAAFQLTSRRGATSPVLTGVQARGRLDGVMFELTLRQTYRNDSTRPLEVIYTFPMPAQAVLLGLACELDGKRQQGRVVARAEGERDYEQALAEGDAPVLLERLPGGLYTANVGNLLPGEELTLELRLAQLLAFEQGRLRLAIPTTIAPRYGSPAAAGLQPQQVPEASALAAYPLSLEVTVAGELAFAEVECPTHRVVCTQDPDGLRLMLAPGAWMDRDVVITVTPRQSQAALVVHARDEVNAEAPCVVMAAMQPPPPATRPPLTLKLLLDCSGSMAGDSIASARRALHGVLDLLHEDDHVSLSRFGMHVEHKLQPTPWRSVAKRKLKDTVDSIEADMGGTEMTQALRAVFELKGKEPGGDVLLLTDGEAWQIDETMRAARRSGHRLFVIGVGSSPAEAALRSLVQAAEGACEFATPGEALEAAARRMLDRIRQQPWQKCRIDWGREPLWQTAVPARAFGGDTLIAMAGFAGSEAPPHARLLALDDQGATTELARADPGTACPGDALPRLAAARRLLAMDDDAAKALALGYQLLSEHTNCVLVHPRQADEKCDEEALVHRVESMLAAGWGGTGSVSFSNRQVSAQGAAPSGMKFGVDHGAALSAPGYNFVSTPSLYRTPRRAQEAQPPEAYDLSDGDASATATLRDVAEAVERWLAREEAVESLEPRLDALPIDDAVLRTLDEVAKLGLSRAQAALLLLQWLHDRHSVTLRDVNVARLQAHVQAIAAGLATQGFAVLERDLKDRADQEASLGRLDRLRRAIGWA